MRQLSDKSIGSNVSCVYRRGNNSERWLKGLNKEGIAKEDGIEQKEK